MIIVDTDFGCATLSWPGWDTTWNTATGSGDWSLAGNAAGNAGGLAAAHPLETAVVLALFTDRRCPVAHPLAKWVDPGDPRGWWGDGVDVRTDLGEGEMGSLLWLLERAAMEPDVERWAKAMIEEALAPLLARKVVVKIETSVERRADDHGLNFGVRLYGADGTIVHDRTYDFAWNAVAR